MISLHPFPRCSSPMRTTFRTSPPRSSTSFLTIFRILKIGCSSAVNADYDQCLEVPAVRRTNYGGARLEDIVGVDTGKLRLDAWISSRIDGISRARVQSSIRLGLVSVNGRVIDKVSHLVKAGDEVNCTIAEMHPLRAEPEQMPLDIVYEDDHVLVINKPAHMVVHPAPGNASGTLVNGILHHCSLPVVEFLNQEDLSDSINASDDEFSSQAMFCSNSSVTSVRPGIVHRLDKGTTGLLVVAKDEHSHAHLSQQFKLHTIERVYISLTCGVPSVNAGRVDVPIGRDSHNRLRMSAVLGPSAHRQARHAASRYKVIEVLAHGGSALVEWKLETGRTHQIRVHAKYMGIPLLGDEVYGGSKNMALSMLRPKIPSSYHGQLLQLVGRLERPCLHALTLGFRHPCKEEFMKFTCPPPKDFTETLGHLRRIYVEQAVHFDFKTDFDVLWVDESILTLFSSTGTWIFIKKNICIVLTSYERVGTSFILTGHSAEFLNKGILIGFSSLF